MVVYIDVMTNKGKRFYKSLQYSYSPLFRFNLKCMISWLYDSLPSLKTKDDVKLHLKFPDGENYELDLYKKLNNNTNGYRKKF